jgi:hypothetical protein
MFNFGHPKLGKMCPKMFKILEVQNLKELGFLFLWAKFNISTV